MQEFAVQIGMHLQAVNVGVHRAQMMHRWSASNCIVFILLPFTPVSLIRAHSSRCEGSGPLLLETRAARGTGRGLEFRALAQEIAAAVLYGFWFALNGIRCPHGMAGTQLVCGLRHNQPIPDLCHHKLSCRTAYFSPASLLGSLHLLKARASHRTGAQC